MSSNLKKLIIAMFIFTFFVVNSFAGFWDALNPYRGPKNNIITLVVTGNYKHPLLIAQLIQQETRQPYLLLPAAGSEGIYFNPPRKRSEAALEIREDNLERFIRFLNPKQIVILGDDRYVPEKYRKMIDKGIPIITISGNNWQRIADRLAILLDACNVGDDYKELGQQLESGLYKPTKSNKSLESNIDLQGAALAPEASAPPFAPEVKDAKEPEVMSKDTPKLIKSK